MHVAIVRGGGVAGLVSRTRLEADALPADDAAALAAHVRRAGLLDAKPAEPARPPAHADEMSYAVTVEHAGEPRTAHFTESTLPEPVRELIAWVDAHPASERSVSPPGAS